MTKPSESNLPSDPPGRSHAAARAFLKAFRRRALSIQALKLFLYAAIVNEAFRWTAVAAIRWLKLDLPVLNVGPFFFLVAFLVALRRWRLPETARRTDRLIGLEDRFTSLLDFSTRRDVGSTLREAQIRETLASSAGTSLRRVLPLHPALPLGPFLLAASLVYPLLFIEPGTMPIMRLFHHPAHFDQAPDPAPSEDRIVVENGEDAEPEPVSSEREVDEEEAHQPVGKKAAAEEEEDSPPQGDFTAAPDLPDEEEGRISGPAELLDTLTSETVGNRLSEVIEPFINEESAKEETAISGRMTYRIVPSAAGSENGYGDSLGIGPAVELVIDFDSIAEQYRPLVRRYFSLLDREHTKERSKDGGK